MKRKIAIQFVSVLVSFIFLISGCNDSANAVSLIERDESTPTVINVGEEVTLDWFYQDSKPYSKRVSETQEYSLFKVKTSNESICYVRNPNILVPVSEGSCTVVISAVDSPVQCSFSILVKGTKTIEPATDSDYDIYHSNVKPTYSITSVNLTETNKTIKIGDKAKLKYTLLPTPAASEIYISKYVNCKSSDKSVVTVSEGAAGYIYLNGIGEGTAEITLTSCDNPLATIQCNVTVEDNYVPTHSVTSITLSDDSLNLDIGQTYPLTVRTVPSSKNAAKWRSSDESVATVNSAGVVTAVRSGNATITAISKDEPLKSATCTVSVSKKVYIEPSGVSFKNNATSITIARGDEQIITATVTPEEATSALSWSVTDSSVVSLTPDSEDSTRCTVKGLKAGSTCKVRAYVTSSPTIYKEISVVVTTPAAGNAKQFFWGEWIRMDNGASLTVEEDKVSYFGRNYTVAASSNDTELKLSDPLKEQNGTTTSIDSFEKESDSVFKARNGDAIIKFYRKGGKDLTYSLKVVGFTDNVASFRAAAASGRGGLTVTGRSNRFKSFVDTSTTSATGDVTLKAPIQGDVQTVVIDVSENKSVVVDNLKIENKNDYLGQIPLVDDGDYSLKITGVINNKTDGYLYAGHTYSMTLTVKNISNVSAKTSNMKIVPDDECLSLSSSQIPNLNNVTISTLKPGEAWSKTINITVNNFEGIAYKDTSIKVNVKSTGVSKEWQDYVPLRVFRSKTAITVAADNQIEGNVNATLNGFLIYPDGNNRFFSIPQGQYRTITAPMFLPTEKYSLVFSGATVSNGLSSSTELYYTVSLNGTKRSFIHDNVSYDEGQNIVLFGEGLYDGGNETEDHAYEVTSGFEAYIQEGETDFYKISGLQASTAADTATGGTGTSTGSTTTQTSVYSDIEQLPISSTTFTKKTISSTTANYTQYFYFRAKAGKTYKINWGDSYRKISSEPTSDQTLDVKVAYVETCAANSVNPVTISNPGWQDSPFITYGNSTNNDVLVKIGVKPYTSGNTGKYIIQVYEQ